MQICPNCGYANRAGVMFCENCGTNLLSNAPVETQYLFDPNQPADAAPKPPVETGPLSLETLDNSDFQAGDTFPSGGLLHLEVGEGTKPIIVGVKDVVLFGRRDAAMGTQPDVDLTPFAGYRMGVSRRHAEIKPEAEGERLNLYDLGSSNGTFLNGDRLISYRAYLLRDSDEIRFGQLAVKVRFLKGSTGKVTVVDEETPKTGEPDLSMLAPTQPKRPTTNQLDENLNEVDEATTKAPPKDQTEEAAPKPSSDATEPKSSSDEKTFKLSSDAAKPKSQADTPGDKPSAIGDDTHGTAPKDDPSPPANDKKDQ